MRTPSSERSNRQGQRLDVDDAKRAATALAGDAEDRTGRATLVHGETTLMRLVVMACSRTKQADPGLLPAGDRYDGPLWRTLKTTLSRFPLSAWPDIRVLSAEYGLIDVMRPIPDYDRVMDKTRAGELASSGELVLALEDAVSGRDEVYLAGGKLYRDVVRSAASRLSGSAALPRIVSAPDGTTIGRLRNDLRTWLLDAVVAMSRPGATDSEIERSVAPDVDPQDLTAAFVLCLGKVSASRQSGWSTLDPGSFAQYLEPHFPGTSAAHRTALMLRSLALYNTLADAEFERPLELGGSDLRRRTMAIASTLAVVEVEETAATAKAAFRKSAFLRRFVRAIAEGERSRSEALDR